MSATKFRLFKDALRHLADARLATITDDIESQYALTDAYDQCLEFVLRQAAWRFALKTVALSGAILPLPGFSNAYTKPADWLRTHALFVLTTDGRERPLDIREQGLKFSANLTTAINLRYVSRDFLDPELSSNPWPEHFAQAVSAYLAFLVADRVTGEHGASGRMSQLFSSLLESAVAHDALAENLWLGYQLDGSFARVAAQVAKQGFWRFALKTVAINTPSSTGDGGLAHSYAVPADWLRTRELFLLTADGRHRPFDIREEVNVWHTNAAQFYAQYVSADLVNQSNLWPDPYLESVQRRLEAEHASVTDEKDQADDFKLGQAVLGDARNIETLAENPWLQYQLDGTYARCMPPVISRGFWRFALKSSRLAVTSGRLPGFSTAFAKPDDWLLTHALFLLTDDRRERPLDIREQGNNFFANISGGVVLRYLSTDAYDSTLWPDSLAKAVMAYLELESADEPDEMPAGGKRDPVSAKAGLFRAALAAAINEWSEPTNRWLQYQLDGSFARCAPAVLARGWWRFCLHTVQVDANTDQLSEFNMVYPYVFPLPSDWWMTHSLFIAWNGLHCPFDIREHEHRWITATPLFLARYMSTAAFDSTLWPETLLAAVLAYLELDESGETEAETPQASGGGAATQTKAAMFTAALQAAMEDESDDDDPWRGHQLSGRFLQGARWVLEQARWRFAIKSVELNANNDPLPGDPIELVDDGTGTGGVTVTAPAQHGYAYRFIKPGDWLRTIWFGRQINEGLAGLHIDTDYIDEGYTLHANWSPLSLRYLSVEKGLDPTQWTAHFRDALLAYLEHVEARGDPKLAKFAAERFKFFQLQLREAESNDDSRDGPLYRQVGRVVRARYGWGRGYGIGPGYGPSQGWWG